MVRVLSLYISAHVACALVVSGENMENHVAVKDIIVDMGIYYQAQDDYLDIYSDFEVLVKTGRDIQDFKCSWLAVTALELGNDEQKKILHENYGKLEPSSVAKGAYEEYESNIYKKLLKSIEAHPNKAIEAVLKSFLGKIYRRQK